MIWLFLPSYLLTDMHSGCISWKVENEVRSPGLGLGPAVQYLSGLG